ncbi:MAG: GNAT family N-acetyltransferase [Proteobacteria bacterium]|nr:GNAT family N-acetyltransferase [Pseudomonadota bacterium]
MLVIRPAVQADATTLTELMHGSSAYRGKYASILDGYSVTPSQMDCDVLYVAERYGAVVGFYSLSLRGEAELDLMFVADNVQGLGVGATLFRHMAAEARRRGISVVKIVSHPPSAGFYQRMGARRVGTRPPTIKASWTRPILTLTV